MTQQALSSVRVPSLPGIPAQPPWARAALEEATPNTGVYTIGRRQLLSGGLTGKMKENLPDRTVHDGRIWY